jgi:oligopeptide/dipeptide ABC transporter ATP-binding protein
MRRAGAGLAGRVALLGACVLLLIAIAAPPLLGRTAEGMDVGDAASGVSAAHWLGTDSLGRDVLARTLVATRLSLGLAFAATAITLLLAVPIGAALALSGARVRAIGARVIDAALAFPGILLAIVVTTFIGPSVEGAVLAIGIAGVPGVARLTYTLAASTAGRDFVQSALALGVRPWRVVLRHVLPNIGDTLAVASATALGIAIVSIASLSFLGLGVNPPLVDWGRMLVEGAQSIYLTPAAALGPAAAIALAGMAFGFSGESIATVINPLRRRVRGGRAAAAVADIVQAPSGATAGDAVLRVEGLNVWFPDSRGGRLPAVRGVDLSVAAGEIVGLVGESGSGKTLTSLAVAALAPYPARTEFHSLALKGIEISSVSPAERDRLLGTGLAMIFQDPSASLNPALRILVQMTEGVRTHRRIPARAARALALRRLTDVQIAAPEHRLHQFPHEYSGGMRQRAMMAMGLMNQPALIIADEPTTALDVTVQAQILQLLKATNASEHTAILLISHDLGMVSQLCSRVLVMYAGRVVEDAPVADLLRAPAHPYSRALLAAVPDLETDRTLALGTIPGRPPVLGALPGGCAFHPRCPSRVQICSERDPPSVRQADGRSVACWLAAA